MTARKQKLGDALRGGMGRKEQSATPSQPKFREADGEYVQAPMELIDPDPEQPREEFTQEYLEALALSMQKNKQRQPINLRRLANGRLLIQEGERRWRAARINGWTHIKAIIEEQPRDLSPAEQADVLRSQRAENTDREPLTLWEDIKTCERYIRLTGKSQREAAQDLNVSVPKLSKMRKVYKAPDEVKDLVRLELCTNLNTLGSLIDLVTVAPEIGQRELLQIRERGTLPERAENYFSELARQAKSPKPSPSKTGKATETSEQQESEEMPTPQAAGEGGTAVSTSPEEPDQDKSTEHEARGSRVTDLRITASGELQITDQRGDKRQYRIPKSFENHWAALGDALFKK